MARSQGDLDALRRSTTGAADDVERAEVTFVGNATTLIRLGGCTIVTDPSFLHAGDHVHVGYGLFAKRLLDPALDVSDLPPLDAILLSHLHGDHWDPPAERGLDHALPLVTTKQAARALGSRGFTRTIGLDVWERTDLERAGGGVRVTAVPARHGPPAVARLLPATNGYVLEDYRADVPLRIYVSGDTMLFPALAQIPERFPEGIDVALLHLGGTRIPHRRFGVMVTLDARGGVQLVRLIDPRIAIPIHTDDWNLFSSGVDEFIQAMRDARLDAKLRVVERGATIDVRP